MDVGSVCHLALISRIFSEQYVEERGLSDSVWAKQSYLFVSEYLDVEVGEKHSFSECLGERFDLHDFVAASYGRAEGYGGFFLRKVRFVYGVHLIEQLFAASCPLYLLFSSEGLELSDYILLPLYLFLIFLVFLFHQLLNGFSFFEVVGVVSAVLRKGPVVDLKYPVDYLVEEVSVMGYHYHIASVLLQVCLEPFYCHCVEVVGRLVKQQDIWFFEEQL